MEGWHKEVRVLDEVSPSRDLWADALARSRRISPSRPYLRSKLVGAIVLTVAVVAAGLGVALSLTGSGHPRTGNDSPGPAGNFAAGPGALGVQPQGMDGKAITLNELVADHPTIPLPDSPSANSSNVGTVWEETATGAVAIWYPSSGIEVIYGGTGVDFTGAPASDIESIGGIKSLVIPAGVEDKFTHLLVPLPGGHLVTLVNVGPVSDLTNVAASIVAKSSASG